METVFDIGERLDRVTKLIENDPAEFAKAANVLGIQIESLTKAAKAVSRIFVDTNAAIATTPSPVPAPVKGSRGKVGRKVDK